MAFPSMPYWMSDTSGGYYGWQGTAWTYISPQHYDTILYGYNSTPLATPTVKISLAERDRRALARTRVPPRPAVGSSVARSVAGERRPVLVPRRTTVVRGTVSFARQGGRRPL